MTSKPVRVFNEQEDITCQCLFAWSTDTVCWTNWVTYEKYCEITKSLESDFYLRILISGLFSKILIDNVVTNCYSICLYNRNPFLIDLCSNNLIDFYANLDCALLMQEQLANGIICMLGIPAYYIRVLPDKDTQDITFKEYVLHNIDSIKNIKLMCQDGALPSSKPQMTEFDFDWENDWEVEMGKREFANAFGDTAFPKQRDMVYVPLFKRMYEVNAAYDEKNEGLMWRAVTWKLGLVKWTEKSNVDQGDFQEIIDCWAVNQYEDMFLEPERKEQERDSGTTQITAPEFAATNLYNIFMTDAIRYSMTNEERNNIGIEQLNHGNNIVARNYYNFQSQASQVLYQKKWCGKNGTVMLCLSLKEPISPRKPLFAAGGVVLWTEGTTLKFGNLVQELELNTIYAVMLTWSRDTNTMQMNVYKHDVMPNRQSVPVYSRRPDMYQFDFEHGNNQTALYINTLDVREEEKIWLVPGGFKVYGCRMYNRAMDEDEMLSEFVRYVTKDDTLIFNDCARPTEGDHGYSVR